MNNLLLILGIIALGNGNISLGELSLFDNKNKKKQVEETEGRGMPKNQITKKGGNNKRASTIKKKRKKLNNNKLDKILKFNISDINKGIKLLDLSDEDLERGMEIITRTKKYMSNDERKFLMKLESLLDLVMGIKKLTSIDDIEEDETNFFRSMEEDEKKNMMIKEILEVFPEKRKGSIEKAIDIKKKIDLFAELFLPDDFGENGFSLSSLASIDNLGSMNNLKLLGSLLRVNGYDSDEKEEDEEYEYEEDYYDEYDDFGNYYDDFDEYIQTKED